MKTLLILRHAKSDRTDTGLADHDRPLAPRGEADAPRMGAALRALGCIPDHIMTSTAVRAHGTARLIASAMGYDGPLGARSGLYATGAEGLLAELRACEETAETVLLVGHNPDLEELVSLLICGEPADAVVTLPTAALAALALDVENWAALAPACGSLLWLLTPRIVRSLLQRK